MKIAVLSDIHDNVWTLAAALQSFQDAQALICCGDLCSPFIVTQLAHGFLHRPIHIVFGNNDGDLFRITQNAGKFDHVHLHAEFFQGEFSGKRFAVNHYPAIALAIAAAGQHDVVCYGHNHSYRVESLGSTLTINPGAIMGYDPINTQDIPATFVIYDTDEHSTVGYQVAIDVSSGQRRVAAYP